MSRRKKLIKMRLELEKPHTCDRVGKVCYMTQDEARKRLAIVMAERIRYRKRKGKEIKSEIDFYKCSYCGYFHLTSSIVHTREFSH